MTPAHANQERADASRSTGTYAQQSTNSPGGQPVSWIASWLVTPQRTAVQTLVWYGAMVFLSWYAMPYLRSTTNAYSWSSTSPGGRTVYSDSRWTEPGLDTVQWPVLAIGALLLIVSGWLIVRSTRECAARAVRVKLPWITGLALGLMLANLFVLAMRGAEVTVFSVKVVLIIDAVLVPLVIAGAVGSLARLTIDSNATKPTSNPA